MFTDEELREGSHRNRKKHLLTHSQNPTAGYYLMLYKHMIQKNTLLNLNIIITVIERRIGTGPKPETETIWIEKKKF